MNRNGSGGSFVLFGKSGARDHSGSYLCASVAGASDSRMAAASATGVEDRRIASSRPSRNDASTTGASGPDVANAAARTASLSRARCATVAFGASAATRARSAASVASVARRRFAARESIASDASEDDAVTARQPASREVETNRRCPPSSSSAPNAPASSSASSISSAVAPPASANTLANVALGGCAFTPASVFGSAGSVFVRVAARSRSESNLPLVDAAVFVRASSRAHAHASPVAGRAGGGAASGSNAPHTVSPRRGSKTTSSSGNPRATKEIDSSSARTRRPS